MNNAVLFIKNLFERIKYRLQLAHNGKEEVSKVIWIIGGISYIVAFFLSKLILSIKIMFIKWIMAILIIVYFIWHIMAIRKCSPAKPKLTDEEKEARKKDHYNRFLRKLFLKEPITEWNSATFAIVVDLYVILVFAGYLFK